MTIRLVLGTRAFRSHQTRWAADHLTKSLQSRGVHVAEGLPVPDDDLIIEALVGAEPSYLDPDANDAPTSTPGRPESFRVESTRQPTRLRINGRTLHDQPGHKPLKLRVIGSDVRGLMYGLLDVADIVEHASSPVTSLRNVQPAEESPAIRTRSVLRTFCSESADSTWFHDESFWKDYFTQLATHRINQFQLAFGTPYNYSHDPGVVDNYLIFAYPFLLAVPGYEHVHASGLDPEERDKNLRTLQRVSRMAAQRGISFRLGLWNHAYDFPDSPHQRYPIEGVNADNHADYCRRALAELLRRCPDIQGITVRVHYEGGIHEPTHEFWQTVLGALAETERLVELDMHAKGVDERILDAARSVGAPLTISAKFVAEHYGLPYHPSSVRPMEAARPERDGLSGVTNAARRFTRYGYGDFLKADRDFTFMTRIWPGTQRLLESGDAEQVAALARSSSDLGIDSLELFEPLSLYGRKTSGSVGRRQIYTNETDRAGDQPWRKYLYLYRCWGRGLFSPETAAESVERPMQATFGDAAATMTRTMAAASRVLPLVTTYHAPSASNNYYWPEIYENVPSVESTPKGFYDFDTPAPGTFEAVMPFDSEMFLSVEAWSEAAYPPDLTTDGELPSPLMTAQYGPNEVAQWLKELAQLIDSGLDQVHEALGPVPHTMEEFRRTERDLTILKHLASFFAKRITASCLYALHRRFQDVQLLERAVAVYQDARGYMAKAGSAAAEAYVNDLGFGDRVGERGHWRHRLQGIDADLEQMRRQLEQAGGALMNSESTRETAISAVRPVPPNHDFTVPSSFVPGEPVHLSLSTEGSGAEPVDAELRYRRTNQGEQWQSVSMLPDERGRFLAAIPSAYSSSPYDLQVYVRLSSGSGAWTLPGLEESLLAQPYRVIPQANIG